MTKEQIDKALKHALSLSNDEIFSILKRFRAGYVKFLKEHSNHPEHYL